eukprot:4257969-Amphidinium_carterae.1
MRQTFLPSRVSNKELADFVVVGTALSLDARYQATAKADAKKRRDGWNQYVKDMWRTAPKKTYKWIRGATAVWDLAVHDEDVFEYSLNDTARVELGALSKLWRPGTSDLQRRPADKCSNWSFHTLRTGICPSPSGP